MGYVIGIDLGTGSLKGVVVDKNGKVMIQKSHHYPLYTPYKGYSEQDPMDWIKAFDKVIDDILTEFPQARQQTDGISFSGQMHTLVLMDEDDNIVRNAILWNDVRTFQECQEIKKSIDIISITKNKVLEGFTLPKLLWVKKNEPENWKKINKFLLPKDFLVWYLTKAKVMDYSDASGTLCLDLEKNIWSKEIFEGFDIPLEIAPELRNSSDFIGNIEKELSRKLGFTKDIKVYPGGSDNACAALAAGIVEENSAMISIGTSGVFLASEGSEITEYDGKLHFFNHVIEKTYYSMGVTLAAGKSLEWFKNTFANKYTFDELLKNIDLVPVGSKGLIFTPYIMGERTPYTDSKIRGSFIGIDANHNVHDFTRSVVEGITFSIKDSFKIMKQEGKMFNELISLGGGSRSENWLQIQADIFNIPVKTLLYDEGPAYGAALIASLGSGWFPDAETCVRQFVKYSKTIKPNITSVKKYDQIYNIYTQVYQSTKNVTHLLSDLDENQIKGE